MNYPLIMLDNPILVSDEEIKEGELFYSFFDGVHRTLRFDKMVIPFPNDRKIIAGLPDLPKLGLSLIAERIGWVDVEKLAEKAFIDRLSETNQDVNWVGYGKGVDGIRKSTWIEIWIEGFKTANSLNERKYSEEDVRQIIRQAIWYTARFGEDSLNREKDILHSLKPKEYLVEIIQEGNTIKVTKIIK